MMDILFADKGLEHLCSNQKEQTKRLGKIGAKKLRGRLADLVAAKTVTELVAGRPHPLAGDRGGQFALDLDKGRRLVFEPSDPPTAADGSITWNQVSSIRIVFIGDYHD